MLPEPLENIRNVNLPSKWSYSLKYSTDYYAHRSENSLSLSLVSSVMRIWVVNIAGGYGGLGPLRTHVRSSRTCAGSCMSDIRTLYPTFNVSGKPLSVVLGKKIQKNLERVVPLR